MRAKKLSKLIYLFVTFGFFLTADAYLSNLIIKKITSGADISTYFLNFNYVKNTGAAFSILQNSTVFLSVLSVLALAVILFYVMRHIKRMPMIGLFWIAILMAGISGNLLERIYFGYVRDYFELTFVNFPVFNISDVFINIGVLAIILMLLNKKYYSKL